MPLAMMARWQLHHTSNCNDQGNGTKTNKIILHGVQLLMDSNIINVTGHHTRSIWHNFYVFEPHTTATSNMTTTNNKNRNNNIKRAKVVDEAALFFKTSQIIVMQIFANYSHNTWQWPQTTTIKQQKNLKNYTLKRQFCNEQKSWLLYCNNIHWQKRQKNQKARAVCWWTTLSCNATGHWQCRKVAKLFVQGWPQDTKQLQWQQKIVHKHGQLVCLDENFKTQSEDKWFNIFFMLTILTNLQTTVVVYMPKRAQIVNSHICSTVEKIHRRIS